MKTFFKITLGIIMVVMLLNIIRIVLTGRQDTIYFAELLEIVAETNNIEITLPTIQNIGIDGDWGILDGIRTFINLLIQIPQWLLWIAQGTLAIISSIFKFLALVIR